MTLREHLLAKLAEESAEVGMAACKSAIFGNEDRNPNLPPDSLTNSERLADELNDLFAVADMAAEAGIIPINWFSNAKQKAKRGKLKFYAAYARGKGTLTGPGEIEP